MTARIVVLFAVLIGVPCAARAEQPTVTLELIPASVLDHRQTELFITVESQQDLSNVVLEVHVPPDFAVSSPTIKLASVARTAIEHVSLTSVNPRLLPGEQALTVTLFQSTDAATRKLLVSKLIKFTYTPEISLFMFFLFGLVGVSVGYWLKLVVSVLSSIQPPPAAAVPPGLPAPGPITRFVRAHYYSVDFLVTVIIAFVVLATLIQGGRPPLAGASWYGAIASGVGLGLFTNSELLTRLHK